jgi:pilus assembly protein Flp/PilA
MGLCAGAAHSDAMSEKSTAGAWLVKSLLTDESGQDLIEYALVAALIALGAIAAMGSLRNKISNEFNAVGNSL